MIPYLTFLDMVWIILRNGCYVSVLNFKTRRDQDILILAGTLLQDSLIINHNQTTEQPHYVFKGEYTIIGFKNIKIYVYET